MILVHLASMVSFVVVTLAVQGASHFALNKEHYKGISYLRPDPIIPLGLSTAAIQGLVMSVALVAWRGTEPVLTDGLWVSAAFGVVLASYIGMAEPSKYTVPDVGKWMRVELSASFVQFAVWGLLLGIIHTTLGGSI